VTQIVVKVLDAVTPPPVDAGVEMLFFAVLETLPPTPATLALDALIGGAVARKAFFSLTEQELDSMVAEAQGITPDYAPPNLNNFMTIDCPRDVDADLVVTLLEQLEGFVEYAYVAPTPEDPVVGTTNQLFPNQRYLKPAPEGIGVQAAWAKGVDGLGVRIIDLERGWVLGTHEDLPKTIRLLAGVKEAASRFHGLAVLGILAAIDDVRGVAGICPAATLDVVSYIERQGGRTTERIADRIATTARNMPFGGVLLLEVQEPDRRFNTKLPVESVRLQFEAIHLATSLGIVVVEAAGNGKFDLDTFTDIDGRHTLNPGVPGEFKQSNAIMVGASRGSFPHQRNDLSNFGSRIDCFAYGDRIATTGDLDKPDVPSIYWDPDKEYRPGRFGFGGTSGASAIIAGVCVLVQDLRDRLPVVGPAGRLGPVAMRALLAKRGNGTDSFLVTDRIGVMPDFAKILANEFQQP
jgi:hypothetical protein